MSSTRHKHSEMTVQGRLDNLKERCKIANSIEGDCIFVSIHANAALDPNASGYEIFVLSKSNKRYEIAKYVHQASKDVLGVGKDIKDRGIKENSFYVLKYTDMPAILVEHEFYTNKEAVAKLKDSNFRDLCAEHIAKGLLNYLREEK